MCARTMIVVFSAASLAAACGPTPPAPEATSTPPPVVTTASSPLGDYQNGLSPEDRRTFYHLSEGGEIIPLSMMQALMRTRTAQDGPGSDALVPFMQNLARYGFIPDNEGPQNVFGLPVGMSYARSLSDGFIIVGFNCSTCHVGEAWHNGTRVRVDGAPNMLRLNDFFKDLSAELDATVKSPSRLASFVKAVIDHRADNNAKMPPEKNLLQRLKEARVDSALIKSRIGYIKQMPTLAKEAQGVDNGYARVDAFGVARNLLFGGLDPRNLQPQDGPASFPHMWGIEHTEWLQWGANMNSVMERNIGQSLGVGAVFDTKQYQTTSRLDNLNTIEHTVYRLTPPAWPAAFGPVDQQAAARGKELYRTGCAGCHERPFSVSPTGLVAYQLYSLKEIGTSPKVAENFDRPVYMKGKPQGFGASALAALEAIKQEYYTRNAVSAATQAQWENRALRGKPIIRNTLADAEQWPDSKGGKVYAARPLAGIWATAPYLNNGSVANMWDLLTEPNQRPKEFWLGSRDYDVKNLGYRSTADQSSPAMPWKFVAGATGNFNGGHDYGSKLKDEDKRALIEFMKILKTGDFQMDPVQTTASASKR
jgi:mono/diheme cytochrome c family protein